MMEIVNMKGESEDNRGRQMIEKRRPSLHIITASHVIAKMEEVHLLCARWKTEAAAWHEEVARKAEEAWQVKEEQ